MRQLDESRIAMQMRAASKCLLEMGLVPEWRTLTLIVVKLPVQGEAICNALRAKCEQLKIPVTCGFGSVGG